MAPPAGIQRLVDNAKMHCPGVVVDAIKLEMFNMFDEFLMDSSIWTNDIPLTTIPNVTSYEISPIDDGAIFMLQYVKDATSNSTVGATMETVPTVVLDTIPNTVRALTAKVSLTVSNALDVDGYPIVADWIVDKFGHGLISGLVYRLMSQPAKPYTNERLAIYNYRVFSGTVNEARVDARHKNLQSGQRWQYPRGWGGSIRQRTR